MATRPSLHGAFAELQRRQASELLHRQGANNILEPGVIGSRNGISSAKLLQTSMGGVLRPITADDLKVFKARAKELGRQYRGGLIARHLDQSAPTDRKRAPLNVYRNELEIEDSHTPLRNAKQPRASPGTAFAGSRSATVFLGRPSR